MTYVLALGAGGANPLGASFWLSSLGASGVFLVLLAETGLLIGFFLPGDSLLFTAGPFCTATSLVHLSLPVVRLAAVAGAPLTGVLGVPTRTFTVWQVLGGLVWSIGVTVAGYALGSGFPGIDRYLLPVIAFIAVVSVVPVVLKLVQPRRSGPGQDAPDGGGDGGGRAARMYRESLR